MHHTTLNDCLNLANIYLDTFFFSLDLIEESPKTNLSSSDEIQSLISNKRSEYNVRHPAAVSLLAMFRSCHVLVTDFAMMSTSPKCCIVFLITASTVSGTLISHNNPRQFTCHPSIFCIVCSNVRPTAVTLSPWLRADFTSERPMWPVAPKTWYSISNVHRQEGIAVLLTIHTFCVAGFVSLGGSHVAGRCSLDTAEDTDGDRSVSAIQ